MGDEPQALGLGMIGGEEGQQPKKQKVEGEAAVEEEASSGSDISREDLVFGFYDSEDENNPELREKYRFYYETVRKSDGFDTAELPPADNFGAIYAVRRDDEESMKSVRECAEYAVQEYNKGTSEPYSKLSAGQEGDLVLRDVIKANYSGCAGWNFYITFRAQNNVTGKTSVFQAKVYFCWDETKKLTLFRPEPVLCD